MAQCSIPLFTAPHHHSLYTKNNLQQKSSYTGASDRVTAGSPKHSFHSSSLDHLVYLQKSRSTT